MDLDRLEEFSAVARLGSIKLAARELGISPATLSARIIKFEKLLGTSLFHRSGSGLTLTEAGECLLPNAMEILRSYKRIQRDVRTIHEHSYNRLRIAITGSTLPMHLGPFLDRLNQDHPNIQIELLDDNRFGIVDGLLSGYVDLYFATVLEDFPCKGLSQNPIFSPTPHIVLPRSHRLADRTMISIRELDREQFLLYPCTAEPAIRDFQLRNLQDSGIHYTLYDSDTSVRFYKLLVPVGKGLLLRPTPMMDTPPNTVCIPVTDLPHSVTTCFFYNETNPNPDVLAFARDFTKEVRQREHRQIL